MAKKMCRGQMGKETDNGYPDEMRGDCSQSGLYCAHIFSTIKSEVMSELGGGELFAL